MYASLTRSSIHSYTQWHEQLQCNLRKNDKLNNTLEYIRTDNTVKNRKLHKFATDNSNFRRNQLFQTCVMKHNVHVYQFSAKSG